MITTHPHDYVDRRSPFYTFPTWKITRKGIGFLMVQDVQRRSHSRKERKYRVVIQPRKMSIAAIRLSLLLFVAAALLLIGMLMQAAYEMPPEVAYGAAIAIASVYAIVVALWKYRPWMVWKQEEQ